MLEGGATQLLKSTPQQIGPGGQSVLAVGGGDLLVHHFYAESGTPTMAVRNLDYNSGWPKLVPTTARRP